MLRWLGQALAWLVILAVVSLIVIAVLVPRIGGATPYTVLTGSMRPDLPPGTLVVVRPAKAADIGVGSVVTYQLASGRKSVATHRVVSVASFRGEPVYRTQGDANDAPDRKWVRQVQIKGKLWYAVPYLGYVNSALSGPQRQIATYGVAGCLFLYAAYMFCSPIRDKRKDRLRTTEKVSS